MIALTSILLIAVCGLAANEANRVVVLVNTNDPDSVAIADYYTRKRLIPQANIIALQMPTRETVTVREFVDTIYNPLLNALIKQKWIRAVKAKKYDIVGRERVAAATHRMSYLVSTRGVPLRIANDSALLNPNADQLPQQFRVNHGSVDSELALLAAPSNWPMTAFVPNPLFAQIKPSSSDAKRVIRVSRLDGPSVAAVKQLIDRSLQAEAEGLMGRAYFDLGGPHAKGDEWLRAASDLATKAFFDTDIEQTTRVMDTRERYDAPAIYMGWYRPHAYGPWRAARRSVPPGAIGFHLHSFSATTLHSTTQGWLGALVAQGYCATVGNVYEPYLEHTHRPQMLLAALLDGHTFGAAAMFSHSALSWQGVAIGDPLYRPFKRGLDAQLKESIEHPLYAYVCLREINRLQTARQPDAALAFARTQFMRRPALPLAYKLAQLYTRRGNPEKAFEALQIVRYITMFSIDEVVLVQQIANFLNQHNQSEWAFHLYKQLIDQTELPKALRISLLARGARLASKQGHTALSLRWTLETQQLKELDQ